LDYLNIPYMWRIIPSLFYDAGDVWSEGTPSMSGIKQSAGFSLAWEYFPVLNRLTNIDKVQFDFPVWMNHTPQGVKATGFRWLVTLKFDL